MRFQRSPSASCLTLPVKTVSDSSSQSIGSIRITEDIMAADMDVNMDIDMDIDIAPDPELVALEAEADTQRIDNGMAINAPDTSMEGDSVPEKVHIRGLDSLATADVKKFIEDNLATDLFERVEWIDDTSANIIYKSPEAALQALNTLTLPQGIDPTTILASQLRPGKKLSSHPDTQIEIRQALSTDVKKPRAHEASRFYLMNPDKDPREARRQRGGRRGGRSGDDREDFQRRKRRQEERDVPFDESMYDDDAGVGNRASPTSFSESGEDRRRKRVRFDGRKGDDLFSSKLKSDGRLRDRSASPGKEGDGRFGFSEEDTARTKSRRRSITPPSHKRSIDLLQRKMDLFADRLGKSSSSGTGLELFPNKTPPAKSSRDLFPNKTPLSNHRRTAAFDASGETSPAAFQNERKENSRDLFDRISRPASSYGRLPGSTSNPDAMQEDDTSKDDFSVRGKGNEAAAGFSIRGAAQGSDSKSEARELFPNKIGSGDLFAGKIQGRGGPRKRAQDLFS